MRFIEKLRERHEDRILSKAKVIEENRLKQEQARQAEIARQEDEIRKEREKLEIERKIQEDQRKEKLKKEEATILAMTAPLDYIVELKGKYTKRIMGKEYTYTRNDYFLCDTPRLDLTYPYSQYKFKKISGEDIGEVFTSSEDDEIKIIDLQGHEYTKDKTINLFLTSKLRLYTIKELNDCLEKVNEKLEEITVSEKRNRYNDKEIKDSIFNL